MKGFFFLEFPLTVIDCLQHPASTPKELPHQHLKSYHVLKLFTKKLVDQTGSYQHKKGI